jgi:hypothetical protein
MGCVINDEFKRIWKEAVATQCEASLWNLGDGPEKNNSAFVRKSAIVVEIWTQGIIIISIHP